MGQKSLPTKINPKCFLLHIFFERNIKLSGHNGKNHVLNHEISCIEDKGKKRRIFDIVFDH